MATSGPGALNLLTGIGSCFFDSVPCLFITGQVNTYEYKFDKPVRQIGFQETDIVSVVKPLTKYAELVTDPNKIRYHLEKAVYMAQSGRPGPVLLDIPMNIQRANVEPELLESFFTSDEYASLQQPNSVNQEVIREIVTFIEAASRPMILVGGGVRLSDAYEELAVLVEKTGIPVVSSLMGLDALPHDNPAFFGLIGSYGNRYSNLALANCDFLLILGSRLDTRQTGTRTDTFARAAKKVHVDIDPLELNEKIAVDRAIHADVKQFLNALNPEVDNVVGDLDPWYQVLESYKDKYPTTNGPEYGDGIDPNYFMSVLSRMSSEGDAVCLDVGQHQMWASQSFRLKKRQRLLNAGGMGAMGFALPAAIGVAKSELAERVIVIAGDGGIQVNIQEFDTIAQSNLPIKVFVMNNKSLGMVRQFQEIYFEGRKQSTVFNPPNLTKIAEAYDFKAFTIQTTDEMESVIAEAFQCEGPVFVDVKLEQNTQVNPKLIVNKPIEDMYPFINRDELKKVMIIPTIDDDIPLE
jgi:acetolactate synthase-1/2/3 large subunit